MKKCLILTSVLALAACGGGSGGGSSSYNNEIPNINNGTTNNQGNSQNPDIPNTNNGMVVSVNNSAETINYAVSLGVVPEGSNYETVLQEFQNMYNIGNGTNTTPTTDELRTAYILAGGNADDFNESTAQSYIAGRYTTVLNNYFTPNGDDYVWAPITQSINDINFLTDFNDIVKFNISDGQIVSVNITDVKDVDNNGIVTWTYNSNTNKFTTGNRYVYLLNDNISENIMSNGGTGNEELYKLMSTSQMNISQIKEHLLSRLDGICESCSESNRTTITNIINGISNSGISVAENSNVNADIVRLGQSAGLSFADFGYITTNSTFTYNDETFNDTSNDVFAGGYNLREVAKPEQDMDFTGSAVAKITSNSDDGEYSMITHTNSANLHLSDGTETLTMNFSSAENPWYDVVVTRTPTDPNDQTHNAIDINNTNNVNNSIAENFRMTEAMKEQAQNTVFVGNTFYGDNGNASEVITKTEFWTVDEHNGIADRGLKFDSVFGGKAQ